VIAVKDRTSAEIRDHLLAEVHRWMHEQADDISLLVFRYRAPAGP
jgi:hypothetical protein